MTEYLQDDDGYYLERPAQSDISIYDKIFKTWKEGKSRPKWPWVVLGHIQTECSDAGNKRWKPALMLMNVGTINGGVNDLERYLKRGFVVLDWYIPGFDEVPAAKMRGPVAITHGWGAEFTSREGQRRITELIGMLHVAKGNTDMVHKQTEQISTLQERALLAERELAELKNSKAKHAK